MPKAAKQRSESATTKTAHFQIHGEDFTRLARERLLDDNPGSAWRIASGLIGDEDSKGAEMHAGLAILQGDKKLVGKNTMQLVDEDPHVAKIHKEKLAWLYAGRIRINERWYRPVAEVTSWGMMDLANDRGMPVNRIGYAETGTTGGYTNRTWHYCFDGEIAPCCGSTTNDPQFENYGVIFEPCGELPHWTTPPRDAHEAIKQWRAAGRQLEERGHALWYKDNGEPLRNKPAGYGEWLDATQKADDLEALAVEQAEEEALDDDDGRTLRTADGRDLLDAVIEKSLIANGIVRSSLHEDERERIEDELREKQRLAQLDVLRAKILKQAGDDLFELKWGEEKLDEDELAKKLAWKPDWKPRPGGTAMIPRAPFLHWAFDRLRQFDQNKPPWEVVSPPGMKMGGDNRYHTDWVIGAGFDPEDRDFLYRGPMYEAACHRAWLTQERYSGSSGVHVLVAGPGYATGRVVHGKPNTESEPDCIVVLPNLRPHYLKATINAVAVITEEGGETAHLAQVGRERGLLIVRVPDACEIYPEGVQLSISAERRRIEEV